MRPPLSTRGLLVILGVSLASLFLVEYCLVEERQRPDAQVMHAAATLTEEWYHSVRALKEERSLWSASREEAGFPWMLGEHYSPITTTLGSREAKETASNPAFAALLVRLFHDAGVDTGHVVGITLSGSFPTLGIATLAAVEVVGARAVLVSSLGSSSYGANQPEATWIDMEMRLTQECGMRTASVFVTPGAEGDSGTGLPEGGLDLLQEAARRTGIGMRIPASLEEGIRLRTDLFAAEGISILVNIGGGQTSLGTCPHAPVLPTGYRQSLPLCSHPGRGVIERVAGQGIPVIHLLNIRELAARHGLPIGGDFRSDKQVRVFTERSVEKVPIALITGFLLAMVLLGKFRLHATESTHPFSRSLTGRQTNS
jgi:poly-gamma-glutamate system protein